jgi:hypothetical protein
MSGVFPGQSRSFLWRIDGVRATLVGVRDVWEEEEFRVDICSNVGQGGGTLGIPVET